MKRIIALAFVILGIAAIAPAVAPAGTHGSSCTKCL